MRYYDTIETPSTGKTFTEDGDNRIIDSDPSVAPWFSNVPENHVRDFDGSGLPIFVYVEPPTQGELDQIELDNAIASKQADIAAKFKELESVALSTANDEKARYIDPSLLFKAAHIDNIGKADVAIVFVGALVDVATVNAYDVNTDPNWS